MLKMMVVGKVSFDDDDDDHDDHDDHDDDDHDDDDDDDDDDNDDDNDDEEEEDARKLFDVDDDDDDCDDDVFSFHAFVAIILDQAVTALSRWPPPCGCGEVLYSKGILVRKRKSERRTTVVQLSDDGVYSIYYLLYRRRAPVVAPVSSRNRFLYS